MLNKRHVIKVNSIHVIRLERGTDRERNVMKNKSVINYNYFFFLPPFFFFFPAPPPDQL